VLSTDTSGNEFHWPSLGSQLFVASMDRFVCKSASLIYFIACYYIVEWNTCMTSCTMHSLSLHKRSREFSSHDITAQQLFTCSFICLITYEISCFLMTTMDMLITESKPVLLFFVSSVVIKNINLLATY
jgi:hypothetical protein